MVYVVVLFIVGGAYTATSRSNPTPVIVVLAASLIPITGLAYLLAWFSEVTYIQGFMVWSWRNISGLRDPMDMFAGDCDDPTAWLFLMIVVFLATYLVPIAAAILLIPIGSIWTFVSFLLCLKDKYYSYSLQTGLKLLTIGLAGLVIAGLSSRLLFLMNDTLVCAS